MHYESEADYNAAMAGQAEAEAQYLFDQEREYNEYLDNLIESKQYQLYSLETCLDLLNSQEFKKSGLTAQQFLTIKKEGLLTPKEKADSAEPEELCF